MRSFIRQFLSVLSPRQLNSLMWLLVFVMLGTGFELLGIGFIIPVLMILMDPTFTDQYPELNELVGVFVEPTYTNVVGFSLAALITFYVLKTLFLFFLSYKQGTVIYSIKEQVGAQLFNGYMRKPYDFYLEHNSAELIRNLTSEVANFGVVLRAGMVLIVDGVLLLSITGLLIFVEPVGSIAIFLILSLSAFAFQYITKNRLFSYGRARQYHEGKRIQHIQQGLTSVKDVKMLAREDTFIQWFCEHNAAGNKAERFQYFMAALPRLFLEFAVVIGLTALVSVQLVLGKSLEQISLVLGVYGVAIFRLLPSVSRILGALQQVRFCYPSVTVVARELRSVQESKDLVDVSTSTLYPDPFPGFEKEISLSRVSFSHKESVTPVLNGVDLIIGRGEFIGIIGGSGAGKSTLADLILGLIEPYEGKISVDGSDIRRHIRGWQALVGYVPQSIYLTDDTIRQNIAFGVLEEEIDGAALERVLDASQLTGFIDDLPLGLDTVVGEHGVRLSGGQRQRIGIARALYRDPSVLVFDEATSALDQETEQELMNTIEALRGVKTIVFITHRKTTLSACDRVVVVYAGKVSPSE